MWRALECKYTFRSLIRETERKKQNTQQPLARDFLPDLFHVQGTRWRSLLSQCAASQKIARSIPDGVIAVFHWHNPSDCTVALGSCQPVTEMSSGSICLGRGRCVGLLTLLCPYADCLELWELQLPRTLRACPALYRNCCTFWFKIRRLCSVGR
jgi:hypothetical protein